jgi:hypothetical protein
MLVINPNVGLVMICIESRISKLGFTSLAIDVEYSQDVVFDWGDLLLYLNEGTFKLIQ